MANKEKEKRDFVTFNRIKKRKKHFITGRKKKEKENKIKHLIMIQIVIEITLEKELQYIRKIVLKMQ